MTFKRDEFPDWKRFPAVLKVVSKQFLHKTEVRGVAFVKSKEDLKVKLEEFKERFPDVDTFILEEKLSGIEAFVGIKRDPSFSHVVAIGTGGIFVELFKDVTFIPVSSTEEEIERGLRKTKLYNLISGFRNYKGNVAEMVSFIKKLSVLLEENQDIYEMDLNPTFITENRVIPADGRVFLKEKRKRRSFQILDKDLFRPESIAVIGATPKHGKVGYSILRNLEHFKGKVFPVNPKYDLILGSKSFPSVLDIEDKVDCAVVCVPARYVPEVVSQCGEKGVKLVVIVSAGFSEVGGEGQLLQEEICKIAKRYGIRILGPNTLGFIVPYLKLNASFSSLSPPEGSISFLSQSGALISAIIDISIEENIGFSEIISLGNQADIEISEAFELSTRDEKTKVILSYVEGIEFGDKLINFLDRKPSVFLKVGRGKEGKKAASSHTGSLAGDYKVFKDIIELKGGIVVDAIDEAFDCCQFLSAYGRVRGDRVLIVTNAGGPGALASDYVSLSGLELPSIEPIKEELNKVLPKNWSRINPIDLIGDATSKRYRETFEVLLNFTDWDICLVIVTPQSMTDVPEISREIIRFANASGKPIVSCLMGGHSVKTGIKLLKREGLPVYDDPFRAVNVIKKCAIR